MRFISKLNGTYLAVNFHSWLDLQGCDCITTSFLRRSMTTDTLSNKGVNDVRNLCKFLNMAVLISTCTIFFFVSSKHISSYWWSVRAGTFSCLHLGIKNIFRTINFLIIHRNFFGFSAIILCKEGNIPANTFLHLQQSSFP